MSLLSGQELGRLFKDEPTSAAGSGASKKSHLRLPGIEEKPFVPLKEQERRVARYWAGKAPAWADEGGAGDAADAGSTIAALSAVAAAVHPEDAVSLRRRPVEAEVVVAEPPPSRPAGRPRARVEAEVVLAPSAPVQRSGAAKLDGGDAESDEDDAAARRLRARDRLAQRRAAKAASIGPT